MTPDKIALVQDSFRKVVPIAGLAADIFYDRLFETTPEVRSLFPADMAEQKGKLVQMLAIAVNGLTKLDEIVPAVEGLGRRHGGYGVTPAHYDAVGAALLHMLGQGLGEAFTPKVEAAWAETYALLAGVMIAAQEKAAA
ncbi:globin family protein [Rubellimicrobium roseum]|uniref:Hemin receptor n=1 Tax=Rubellimicrobium roseum TaxID=687525 RepID=A0A5C4NBV1_9RHOB|nr:globin family protein [Rubellimicrobium roseum]TNC63543.1 hemin receptor [Rubellimicrobium roseum]